MFNQTNRYHSLAKVTHKINPHTFPDFKDRSRPSPLPQPPLHTVLGLCIPLPHRAMALPNVVCLVLLFSRFSTMCKRCEFMIFKFSGLQVFIECDSLGFSAILINSQPLSLQMLLLSHSLTVLLDMLAEVC